MVELYEPRISKQTIIRIKLEECCEIIKLRLHLCAVILKCLNVNLKKQNSNNPNTCIELLL